LEYSGGSFGGGRNDTVAQFEGRGDLVASAFWELKNFGFGNRAQARERTAQLDQTAWQERAVRAQVAAEVTEAARVAAARMGALNSAQTAIKEALELYRKLLESSFGMAGPQPRYDALEPLLAIQALHQARLQYLQQVIEFNRAQFRLYAALGQPAESGLPGRLDPSVSVPVIPKP
jgi:outer membrane protein TolC